MQKTQEEIFDDALDTARKIPEEGFHLYLRKSCVHTEEELDAFLESTEEFSRLYLNGVLSDVSLEKYISKVYDFEIFQGNSRIFEVLQVLIPLDFPESQYLSLCQVIALEHFSGSQGVLPYFVRTDQIGNSKYLYMVFSERYYYPEGNVVKKVRTSDFYRNKKNGRRCSKDDPDAILVWNKGDVISEDVQYFSKKERFFRINDAAFFELLHNLKQTMLGFFRKFCIKAVLFGRLCYDGIKSFAVMKRCRIFNQMLARCEAKATEVLYAFQQAGYEEAEKQMYQKVSEWKKNTLKQEGSILLGNHRQKYQINFRSPVKSYRSNVEIVEMKFDQSLQKFIDEISQSKELLAVYDI